MCRKSIRDHPDSQTRFSLAEEVHPATVADVPVEAGLRSRTQKGGTMNRLKWQKANGVRIVEYRRVAKTAKGMAFYTWVRSVHLNRERKQLTAVSHVIH